MSLGLLDVDLLLLGDRVEEELRLEGLARVGLDLGAVLVVLEAVLALEVGVDLGLHDAVGDRDLDGLEQQLEDLVAGLDALLHLLGALGLLGDVGLELLEGVELGGQLGEVVVHLGRLRTLTDWTVTVTSASWPSRPPPASGAVKVLVSPEVMPMSASSMPSSMLPDPTS